MKKLVFLILFLLFLSSVITADNQKSPIFVPAMVSVEQEGVTGIYEWQYTQSKGSSWEKILGGLTAEKMISGDITGDGNFDITVWFSDGSLYSYDIIGNYWSLLCGSSAGLTDFTLAQIGTCTLIISNSNAFQGIDAGINYLEYGTGWHNISSETAEVLAGADITADGTDELIYALAGIEGMYVYDFGTESSAEIAVVSPSQVISADIIGDGYDEAVAVFPGFGVYLIRYVPDKNISLKMAVESPFDPGMDIKENSVWVSKSKSGKGLQFNRLTWGVPDEGTRISAGDITGGTGKELFMAYQGRTCYFCYDTMLWSTLLHMPFKTLLAGRFTDSDKDALLACASASGDIWLRHADNTWEHILPSGNTNAMSAIIYPLTEAHVPKTGQITSYREGDDGDYQMGVAWPDPRFTDHGDGTVTDNLTGLMWTKSANIDGLKTWDDAIDWCNALTHGGHDDWRLPNRRELFSLIDKDVCLPVLPAGHPFTDVQIGYYLSSSTYTSDTDSAWYVNIGRGSSWYLDKTDTNYVWAVRGLTDGPAPVPRTGQITSYRAGDDGDYQMGVQWPDPRFTDHGDGTVTDNLTGLMWTKSANIDIYKNWDDAIDWCNALIYAGHDDWRLPNILELHSLIALLDYDTVLPAGHPFTGIQSDYWSSTTDVFYPSAAWIVYMDNGNLRSNFKTNPRYVWPVRSGQ